MNRNIIIFIIVSVVVAIIVFFAITNKSSNNFGDATVVLLEEDRYSLACDDAKYIYDIILDMQEEYTEDPNKYSGLDNISDNPEDLSKTMKKFDKSMNDFNNKLQILYAGDEVKLEAVLDMIGRSIAEIMQVSILESFKRISKEDSEEYIDIEFCDAEPKEGWVSPFDQDLTTIFDRSEEGEATGDTEASDNSK